MFKSSSIRSLCAFRRVAPVARRSFAHCRPYGAPATARIQPVRFKRRIFTWKRLFSGLVYTTAAVTWVTLILGPTVEIVEEEEYDDDEEGEWEEAEEYDEDALFIPLWLPKPVPRRFYRASDPEWQEFRKLAADSKRHEHMRNILVGIIRSTIAKDQMMARRFGPIDVTKGRFWLDITFPDGPPQEYDRVGIEIGDDYIAWTRRPIDQPNYHRLKRAIQPKAVAWATLASVQYLFRVQMNRLRETFGFSPKADPRTDMLQRHLEAMARAKQIASNSNVPNRPPGAFPADASERTVAANDSAAKGTNSNPTTPAEKNASLSDFTPIPPQSIAWSIFVATLAKNWEPMPVEPPRGTVVVSGLVEVQGTKARCTVDVVGAYDPVVDKYVILEGKVRRMQDKQQRPRGGR